MIVWVTKIGKNDGKCKRQAEAYLRPAPHLFSLVVASLVFPPILYHDV